MKLKRMIISISVIIVLAVIIGLRLVSNKQSLDKQLKMVSEFNTTVPVTAETVKYEQVTTSFNENGTFNAIREISVISEAQGKVVSIASKTGDKVKQGQVLAHTDNGLARSQLDLAKFTLEKAEKDMHRLEELSKSDAATQQQFEMAKQAHINAQTAYIAAETQYENTFIKAPFDGSITKQYIEPGTYLLPGTPVYDLVEINMVKLIVKLTAAEVEKIKQGQTVRVSVDAYPGRSFHGIVNAIVVKADQSKRFEVEISVDNADNGIKPGMVGTALFTNQADGKSLLVPRKALTGSIKNARVFVVKGDSVALQTISAVSLDDKNIIVKQGLRSGDVVITSGQINLVDGSKIKLNK